MTQKMVPQQRNNALDGVRAFSAVGILVMHVLSNGNYNIGGFVTRRMIPEFTNLVFLFMIISGYAMCCGYYDKILHNQISFEKFYSRRIQKIWPFFAFWTVVDAVLSPGKNAIYEAFANLTLCFGLLPNANISVIGVGWFIGLVCVFYLVFPFFCYLLANKTRAWISFAVALIFNYVGQAYFHTDRANIVYSAVFFLAGGLIFLYKEPLKALAQKYKWVIFAAIIAGCCGYFLIGTSVPLMLALFSLIVIYTMAPEGRYWILSNPVTRFLGDVSLEIYICHMVAFRLLEKLKLTHVVSSDILSFVITAAATLIGAIVLSVIVKKLLLIAEKIAKNLFNKKSNDENRIK